MPEMTPEDRIAEYHEARAFMLAVVVVVACLVMGGVVLAGLFPGMVAY